MIELQSLNYIIASKDVAFLEAFGEEFYTKYSDEYKFIRDHYREYRTIPDIETVQQRFGKFEKINVTESKKYLEDNMCEERDYRFFYDLYGENSEIAKTAEKSATKARIDLMNALQNLKNPVTSYGVNIIETAKARYERLIERMNAPEKYIFSTGLKELDMAIGGMYRGEELIVVIARTGNGKSWIAEKMAISVWEQGYNVGFFSPEMSSDLTGYRFDTLFKHFDNRGIQGNDLNYDTAKYKSYVETLSKNKTVFSVTEPVDFNNNVTISALRQWCIDLDLKLLVLDGLSYLANERGHRNQADKDKLTELCTDLHELSKELGIPIIVVHQANRTGARDKDGEISKSAPELDTIFGSDGISHNATRVLSVVKTGDMLTVYVAKNRYGAWGQKLMWNFLANTGEFTYLDNPKSGLAPDPSAPSIREQFEDKEETF